MHCLLITSQLQKLTWTARFTWIIWITSFALNHENIMSTKVDGSINVKGSIESGSSHVIINCNNTHAPEDSENYDGGPFGRNSTDLDTGNVSQHEEEDTFDTLIRAALHTLTQSDIQRPDGSSSQGRWVYGPAADELQNVLDRLVVCLH